MQTTTNEITARQPGSVQAPTVKAQAIKLGLDVHADRYVVVRQMDGNTPQPPACRQAEPKPSPPPPSSTG